MTHVLAETDKGGAIRLMDTASHLTALPKTAKGRQSTRRDLAKITTLVMHQTAVKGGFGVTSRQLARFADNPDTEQLARVARYKKTPYHGIYSPKSKVSVVQWPAWAYMYHGHKSNRYSLGWAYDGLFPGDDLDASGARESLLHLLKYAQAAGCEIKHIEFHRQHSNKPHDPGEEISHRVAVPFAAKHGLTFTDTITGKGLATPASWLGP